MTANAAPFGFHAAKFDARLPSYSMPARPRRTLAISVPSTSETLLTPSAMNTLRKGWRPYCAARRMQNMYPVLLELAARVARRVATIVVDRRCRCHVNVGTTNLSDRCGGRFPGLI